MDEIKAITIHQEHQEIEPSPIEEKPAPQFKSHPRALTPNPNPRSLDGNRNAVWYRNNLLAGAGYLEFANAGDFAANVWSTLPVPRVAVVFMAIGGSVALFLSAVAIRDGCLSWRNLRSLLLERESLHTRTHILQQDKSTKGEGDMEEEEGRRKIVKSYLAVNAHELGHEIIERLAMDILLGFGALLVGSGTILAIWGGKSRGLWVVSNLLSGYVGNAFAAVYGVINSVWCSYLVFRYTSKIKGVRGTAFQGGARRRFQLMRGHAMASGVVGMVAGVASMLTARWWWGYIILVPCMGVQVGCNYFWRGWLGYDRVIFRGVEGERVGDVFGMLEDAVAMKLVVREMDVALRLGEALALIQERGLQELFSDYLSREGVCPRLRSILTLAKGCPSGEEEEDGLQLYQHFLSTGASQLLIYRERYLLEVLSKLP